MNDTPQRTPYQKRVIRDYYRNRDAIAERRVQELITDVFLAEGKKRVRCWDHLESHLKVLGMPAEQIAHLRKQDRPDVLARAVEKLLKKRHHS